MKKKIAILGSTSIPGTQALNLIKTQPDSFQVEVLSSKDQADLLVKQANEFQPNTVVVLEDKAFQKVKEKLSGTDIKVYGGMEALCDVVTWDVLDMILVLNNGFIGVRPTLSALEAEKTVAIGNNETLAAAGELIRQKINEKDNIFIPINSGLSSLFQSLLGEDIHKVKQVSLMASGGPFLDRKPNFLINVKKDHALANPSHLMEPKARIDEASLMNKGLEMLAMKWLFNFEDDQLQVLIHPEAVLQSLVEFQDGTIKTIVGRPEIETPLAYALNFPERKDRGQTSFSFHDFPKLTFGQPDVKTFRSLAIVRTVMVQGNNVPCILNAANEVVTHAFLENKIGFLEMYAMIEEALSQISLIEHPTLEDLIETDKETRTLTQSLTQNSQLYN